MIDLSNRFLQQGDQRTVDMLEFMEWDEVTHVSLGNKWLRKLYDEQGLRAVDAAANQIRADNDEWTATGAPVPFTRWACEAAGFTDAEMDRLLSRTPAR